MSIEAPVQVRKRLVFFIQDFEPRGLAKYYQSFHREFSRTCDLYGLSGKIGSVAEDSKDFTAAWDVTTNGDGWQVETRYVFLRWDDILQKDFKRAPWWKVTQMYRTVGIAIRNGVFRRVWRANRRFGLVALFPLLQITAWIFLGSLIGVLCMTLVGALGAPPHIAKFVAMMTGIGGFATLLWLTDPLTKLLDRCDAAATTNQIINRKRKDIGQRMEVFAGGVIEAVSTSKADEVVVVGHGLGAVLAVDVLGRALTRDPEFGQDGPHVTLLTLGANLPVVGFDPEAKWFRNRLRQLAVAPGIDWVDVQSRDDALNFCPFDPLTGHDIFLEADERRNPHVVTINFSDLWKSGAFGFRRWRFFKAHFQYLAANERLGAAYDYFLICCGPLGLMGRVSNPQAAIAAFGAKNTLEMAPAPGH